MDGPDIVLKIVLCIIITGWTFIAHVVVAKDIIKADVENFKDYLKLFKFRTYFQKSTTGLGDFIVQCIVHFFKLLALVITGILGFPCGILLGLGYLIYLLYEKLNEIKITIEEK